MLPRTRLKRAILRDRRRGYREDDLSPYVGRLTGFDLYLINRAMHLTLGLVLDPEAPARIAAMRDRMEEWVRGRNQPPGPSLGTV